MVGHLFMTGSHHDDRPGWASFCLGLAAGSPIMAGVAPFGLIYGAAARGLDLSLGQTIGMSLTIFAGSSQLVFLDLWGQGASSLALILTGLVINLRIAMYSASISPHLGPLGLPRSLVGAYFLTDEAYALSMGRFLSRREPPPSPFHFYLGAALPTWLSWQFCSLAGSLAGALIPESWPLGMAVPLVFLALLIPMLARGPKVTAALASMVVAIAAAGLPLNLGLILAVFVGIAAGLVHSRLRGGEG
jgi:Predicted branched-chain amino acid permease (azaleucine resistance)